jgi:hypothetical protein
VLFLIPANVAANFARVAHVCTADSLLGEQCSARFWGIMGRDHDPRVSKSNRLHVRHCSVIHHQFEVYSLNSLKTIRNFS